MAQEGNWAVRQVDELVSDLVDPKFTLSSSAEGLYRPRPSSPKDGCYLLAERVTLFFSLFFCFSLSYNFSVHENPLGDLYQLSDGHPGKAL